MNDIRYIYKVRAKLLMWMSAAILLTACSDDTDRLSDKWDFLQIAAYTKDMVSLSDSAATRAVSIPSKYKEYEGSSSIGVFMTQTPTTENSTKMTLISYEDKAWHSMVKVSEGQDYYIYGYMPAYATCTINPNTSFDNGATLEFTDVPSVMSEDFSVITGALQLKSDQTENPSAIEEGNLKAGTFEFKGKAPGNNFVDLMFDHLYGALKISMNVYNGYDALRTIKLKELKLRTSANGTPTKSKTTVTVTLNKTDGTSPIAETGGVVFTPDPTSDDMDDMPFFQSSTGEELTKASKSFEGHFMPKGVTSFVLTSVYDVYDKQGNLIRKECTAQNTLEISKLFDRQDATKPGWRYNVDMTIMPSFLYILSDPDLDNPTVVVN